MKKLFAALGILFFSNVVTAATTGARSIYDYGCHLSDTTCYVTLDGNAVGEGSCVSSSIRWDSSTVAGKNWLALFTAAYMAGKKVTLDVAGCYAAQPSFPTFRWGAISN